MLRYIGEYKFRDIVNPKGIPRIVPQALFDKVQRERAKNKRATARHNLKRGKRFDYRMLRCTSLEPRHAFSRAEALLFHGFNLAFKIGYEHSFF